MRVLPKNLEDALKQPVGKLVQEEQLIKLLEHEPTIISIGDQVTYTLLKHNLKPIICIVDFIIQRQPCQKHIKKTIQEYGNTHLHITNPPGCISDELWQALEKSFAQPDTWPVTIIVDGEEDLASLAAIYLAPSDATIIYGLPNKGVIVLKVNQTYKQMVKEVLDKM